MAAVRTLAIEFTATAPAIAPEIATPEDAATATAPEPAAAAPTVGLPPAAIAAATPPASAVICALSFAVTFTAPPVLIALPLLIRASLVSWIELIETEPAPAKEMLRPLPEESEPAMP